MQNLSRRMLFITAISALAWIASPINLVSAETPSGEVTGKLEKRIEGPRHRIISCRGAVPCRSPFLRQFYVSRGFQPAWSGDQGLLPYEVFYNQIRRLSALGYLSRFEFGNRMPDKAV